MKLFKLALIALPFMFALDFSWATIVAKDFYTAQLGALITTQPVVWAIVAFYILYSFAIAYFAVLPALRAHSYRLALMNGALLGLTGYGMYDLVSLGTVVGYSFPITIVDIIWGVVVTTAVSAITYGFGKRFVRIY